MFSIRSTKLQKWKGWTNERKFIYLFYSIFLEENRNEKLVMKSKKCNRSQGSKRKNVGRSKTDTIFNLINTQHNGRPISLNICVNEKWTKSNENVSMSRHKQTQTQINIHLHTHRDKETKTYPHKHRNRIAHTITLTDIHTDTDGYRTTSKDSSFWQVSIPQKWLIKGSRSVAQCAEGYQPPFLNQAPFLATHPFLLNPHFVFILFLSEYMRHYMSMP